jgi:hypothetical protein
MILPNDVSRCDGLLPKLTQLDGKPMVLWANDCPKRESCRRFLAMEAESWNYNPHANYTTHHHAPGDECPDFLQEINDKE